MNENQNANNNHPKPINKSDDELKERSEQDRRKQASEGFIRISTVGWICRREKTRREGEAFKWD